MKVNVHDFEKWMEGYYSELLNYWADYVENIPLTKFIEIYYPDVWNEYQEYEKFKV